MLDQHVLALGARQHGVVAARQLRADFGISAPAIASARRRGLLVPMAPGVLRIASSPESFDSRCMALHLHADGRGYLSGWTAGRLHGLRKMPAGPVHITVPESCRRQYPRWASVHLSSWYSDDDWVRRPDGLAVATPLRMLFGLAATFNQFRFERAAEDAWHRHLLTPADAAAYLHAHRCRGKDGVRRVEAWLDKALLQPRPAQSDLERALLEALERVDLPRPVRQFPLTLANGELVHLDIAWPRIRFAVEPGAAWWHGGDLGQRRDQGRDRDCSEVGWHVVRFDDEMRADPDHAARQVARIHRRRALDLGISEGSVAQTNVPLRISE